VRRSIGAAPALLSLLLVVLATAAGARPPHIVLIVADDLGYSDLGSYGGEIATPTLDRLAFAGIRFTRFYGSARCSPTRAALLTGVWPHEAGMGHLANDWGKPGYRGAIPEGVPTIAERLRDLGYSTHMVGKWHLTPELAAEEATAAAAAVTAATAASPATSETSAPASWPLQRGFDSFYGTLGGSDSYFDPMLLFDGNRRAVWPPGDASPSAGRPYLTDVFGDRAARLVTHHFAAASGRPFFLYLAFTAPHWPLMAPEAEIERYRGRYDAGWDELRAARFTRQRELGIVSRDAELPARDRGVTAWTETPEHDWQSRRMEVYAGMVTAMDRAVARVIGALENAGALDDTVVLFLSDNGACAEELRGVYALAPLFVRHPRQTADGLPVRFADRPEVVPGPADTWSTYGRSWAHFSNTPLRGYKHWTWEGGITVPFFVHWPARLAGRAGTIETAPGHVVDVVPTLEAIAGRESSDAREEPSSSDSHLRGASLLALLRGETSEPRTLYWEHEGNRAISDGDWKLVSRWPSGWELYDLASDRFETRDLASSSPQRVNEMAARWSEWASNVGVEPWPLVVPWVETTISTAAIALFALVVIARAVKARRAGSPPRTPGPFPGGRRTPRPPRTPRTPTPLDRPAAPPRTDLHSPAKPIHPR
jgi:arylsulfatase